MRKSAWHHALTEP